VPADAEIEDGAHARLERDPDPRGVPPRFTMVSPMNMERTLPRSTSNDPRTGEYLYLWTHFHMEVWLLLIVAQRPRGAPEGEAGEIQIHGVEYDAERGPTPDLYLWGAHCGSGGVPHPNLDLSIGLKLTEP
jgi:hypothetical protein